MSKSKEQIQLRKRIMLSLVVLFALLVMFGVVSATKAVAQEQAARAGSAEASPPAPAQEISPERAQVSKFGLIAAAVAFGFGAMGAGLAIGNVGSAAMGAVAEKPEIAGQALIFIALAEGLVVFGFITALMILGKV